MVLRYRHRATRRHHARTRRTTVWSAVHMTAPTVTVVLYPRGSYIIAAIVACIVGLSGIAWLAENTSLFD